RPHDLEIFAHILGHLAVASPGDVEPPARARIDLHANARARGEEPLTRRLRVRPGVEDALRRHAEAVREANFDRLFWVHVDRPKRRAKPRPGPGFSHLHRAFSVAAGCATKVESACLKSDTIRSASRRDCPRKHRGQTSIRDRDGAYSSIDEEACAVLPIFLDLAEC